MGLRGFLTETDLHRFLINSVNRFADSTVLISLSSPSVESVMQSLEAKGLVSYEIMASYSKDAEIQAVSSAPENIEASVKPRVKRERGPGLEP